MYIQVTNTLGKLNLIRLDEILGIYPDSNDTGYLVDVGSQHTRYQISISLDEFSKVVEKLSQVGMYI